MVQLSSDRPIFPFLEKDLFHSLYLLHTTFNMSEEIKEIPKSQVETGAVDKKAAQKDLEKGLGHRPTPEKLKNDSMIKYFYFLRD